jgi:hypothetical protein
VVDSAPRLAQNAGNLFHLNSGVHGGRVDQHDVERIARATLRELGVVGAVVTIAPESQPGQWRIDIRGAHGPDRLRIKCGEGSTAQWVRQQIFDQYTAQS